MKNGNQFPVVLASLSVTALLLGLAIGWGGNLYFNPSATQAEDQKPPANVTLAPIRVTDAQIKELAAVRPFYGRLTEIKKVTLSPEVSGILKTLSVEEGDYVTGNETIIAEIDQTWTTLALQQAEAQIALYTVQLELQMQELGRLERLGANKIVTESELTQQRIITEQLSRQIIAAELTRDEAKERLERSHIVAPFDGIVVRKTAEIGQLVSSGTQIVEIISRGEVYAEVQIGEMYLGQLNIGDTIPIFIEALGLTLAGKIEAIVPYGPTSSRTFPVKVLLHDADDVLKVGMSVTAYVQTRSPSEGVVVPKDAVWIQPQGSTVWAFVPNEESAASSDTPSNGVDENGETLETGKVYQIPVDIIVRGVEEYMIEAKPGEKQYLVDGRSRLVIEGLERLSEGQEVRLVSINPAFLENLPKAFGHMTIDPKPRKDLLVEQILSEAREREQAAEKDDPPTQ